jgi:hypothetical protein
VKIQKCLRSSRTRFLVPYNVPFHNQRMFLLFFCLVAYGVLQISNILYYNPRILFFIIFLKICSLQSNLTKKKKIITIMKSTKKKKKKKCKIENVNNFSLCLKIKMIIFIISHQMYYTDFYCTKLVITLHNSYLMHIFEFI